MTKLLLLSLALAACEGLTTPPEPAVSVLVRTTESCFALMTPQAPVSPALGLADLCPYTANPELIAGIDFVEIVVDYGANVDFAPSTAAPPPTITVTVDGAAADVPITLSPEQRVGDRAFFVATLRAPSTPSRDIQITAGVNSGFQTAVPVVFQTVPPQVELVMLDCNPGETCVLTGAVGDAHVHVLLPGDVPETVAIHEAIDGVVQPDPIPTVTTAISSTHTEAIASIPVPAAHDGALLALSASLDGSPPTTITAILRTPTLTVQLSCGDTCDLAAGEAVAIDIDAPALIHPLQALVDTSLDGTPQLVGAPVTLIPNANGIATGTLALAAPDKAGTWQIDVSVAGYTAPVLVTTVH